MLRLPQKYWRVAEGDAGAEAGLVRNLSLDPLVARLLVNRGVTSVSDAERFLSPSLDDLADPFLLPDAGPAAERIRKALVRHERICVHGDYDADGVTSAALWTRFLEKLGADVSAHVPNRHRDGYDIRSKFVHKALDEGVQLIITTDCGTQRVEEVAQAQSGGADVIVTDHHEVGDLLPGAVAVVNPQRSDSQYPYRDLSGVGVAFRVGEAVVRHLGLPVSSYRRAFVDLAAIGTVTDIMPLTSENRAIVREGLSALRETRKVGLRALMASAGVARETLNARSIGFVLGPRLNAVGRMDEPTVALDLLLSRDVDEAGKLAGNLEEINILRQQEQQRVLNDATQMVERMDWASAGCLVLSSDTWHAGIIGIVANKLVERYRRPTVLIAVDPATGKGRGSARSIRAFDLYGAISQCGDMLEEFGGHAHAAGLSIVPDHVPGFADAMNRIALQTLTSEDFVPVLSVDAEVEARQVTCDLVEQLAVMEPFGRKNEEPVLLTRGMEIVEARRIGRDQNHLKLRLRSEGVTSVDALMWGAGELAETLAPGGAVDACYRPEINRYNGRQTVQFMLEDVRESA